MNGWLSPYRVIDLTDERGLLAGSMLARLGAEVIQVEPPHGNRGRRTAPFDAEGRSCYWSAFAAGKKSVVLDLADAGNRERFLALVATADFLIESETPGYLDSLDLSREQLRAARPDLIHVSITPFGSDGPKRHFADAELILWAAGGPLHPNRDNNGVPLRISVPQAYLHAAADAAAGALIAHLARVTSGRGQHVDISVQQSVTQATIGSHLAAAVGHAGFSVLNPPQTPGTKAKLDLSGSGSRTRRSKWVVRDGLVEMHLGMGPATGERTNNLFAWMREANALPAELDDWNWVTLPKRLESGELNEESLEFARGAVARFLADKTKVEIQTEALARKLLASPINDVGDLLASEQLIARGAFQTVTEGDCTRTIPWAFAHGPDDMFAQASPAPQLGADTAEILAQLSNTQEIDA
ncbi:CoA transferase [Sphingomonas soli]|uniref:CoA transferase n=1 Tax=Sphingomonas soli TaxID=266127 RepID=UPI00082DBF49|nr:CoA transferase [Sphingomonas soli]